MKKEIDFYPITNVGIKRTNNEDAFLVEQDVNLFIVADGMGGHSSGEVASKIAVETIGKFFKDPNLNEETTWPYEYDDKISFLGNKLKTAIAIANEKIQEYSKDHIESRGMGTTVVALHKSGDKVILCHVGDSRCYLLRDKKLILLTSDHSWVNEQVKMGFLTESEAQRHPFRNVITKALGTKGEATAEVTEMTCKVGDTYLLCTDGLNSMIADSEIENILLNKSNLQEMGEALIDAANKGGGEDNITLILVKILH
ncbi:MAG: Stp1/IreP family PP2C-type Ser/Thr phosphatase [Acidobacteriota bacterium]|nr:Stp1/IreP family PP2C-type Ser/Thr phosphatase [Thermoanaerobaculaceae bacterium]